MNTYSEQPDGPGAMLWAVIITIMIIGALFFMIYGCEPVENPSPVENKLKSEESESRVTFGVTFPDFEDTVINIVIY